MSDREQEHPNCSEPIGLCCEPSANMLKTQLQSNNPCLNIVYDFGAKAEDEAGFLIMQNFLFDAIAALHARIGQIFSRIQISVLMGNQPEYQEAVDELNAILNFIRRGDWEPLK